VDIAAWLRSLGLEQYEQQFRDNAIDDEVLPGLTDEHLKELCLPLGHRVRLLNATAALVARAAEQASMQPIPPAPPLPEMQGERRQVTVLFADLAGYTALTNELDAEEIQALLERFFERVDRIVEEHGGYIEKHIGDCIMAVFGAPIAHGNDAERCIRAALAIRDVMPEISARFGRPIGVHIGIAGGQVVASGIGSASYREYTVTGDTVNLASRLTDAAAAGEILISERIRRALAKRLDCVRVDEFVVKGFAQPVQAWRLLGLRPISDGECRPLVGRQSELRQFAAALTACRETSRGQAIYVRGEAGIGKTRLVEEFQHAARAAGFACHTGLVLDFGAGRDAIRALVRSLVELEIGSDIKAVQMAAASATTSGLVTPDHAVFLNDLLDLPQPSELRALYDAMDNAARNRGKRRTVARLVEEVSRAMPCLLVVEDVHWADHMVLAHLVEVTTTVAECPALLVMTSRIEGDPLDTEWRSRVAGTPLLTIDLGPLRREEALALAGDYFDATDRFAEQCVERAAGNPLFLEQLLQHAEESAEASVPGSVQNLVQARLDRLDPADKAAVQAASVLGQRFDRDALCYLLGRPGYALERLVAHALVRPQGEAFLFAHAIVQESIYDTLLRSRRRDLHRRAADWFSDRDPTLWAEHLERADDTRAPQAYLEAARVQALEYRTDRALRLVERGLALAKEPGNVSSLSLLRGQLLHDLGSIPESIAAFEQALSAADDNIHRCRAWLGLAAGMRVIDRFEEAFVLLDKAATVAANENLAAESARIHHLRGNLCFPLGRLDECLKEHQRALDLAREARAPEMEARTLGGLGDAEYARGRMISAGRNFNRCVELARECGAGRIEVANLSMVAHTQVYLNDFPGALATSQAAVDLAARVGHHRAEIIAHNAACKVFRSIGEFTHAKAHAERALDLARQLGARRFEAVSLNDLAMAIRPESTLSEALDLLHRALAICRETGISFMGPWILGHLAAATRDPAARRAALAEGEEILQKGAVGHNHLWFLRYAIEASLDSREWESAERYSGALEAYTRPEPLPWSDFCIARGRALAAFGRGERCAALTAEIRRLRGDAERLGLKITLPLRDAARPRGREADGLQ
jgi:class 3 adenylate cyclase/tetratricopeptide (TPR) repeat protein